MEGGLLNLQVLGSAKQNITYYFCTLELLSPKDFTYIKHILNVEKGKGPQNLIWLSKG